MKIDVVCPLWKADEYIDRVINNLRAQEQVEIVHVIFPVTESGSDDSVISKIQAAGYEYFMVPCEKFSHSLTRETAMEKCTSDVVVMMSQDVIYQGNLCLYNLAKTIVGSVVYAYGRQLCKDKTIENYTREKNYGRESFTVCKSDIDTLQLRAFFASDAFSAYNRAKFLELGGYDHIHMMFNEDMYYARKILEAGYQKAYAADAVVEHSHALTFKQLYNRYYQTGIWFGEHPEFDGYKTTDTGMRLAISVFRNAIKDANLPVLCRFLPDMASRYLGMKAGKRAGNQSSNIRKQG